MPCAPMSKEKCHNNSVLYSDWPNDNLSITKLQNFLKEYQGEEVYSYIVDTIDLENGTFVQYGSAPNVDGGVFTLCTCKHQMRSYKTPEDWQKGYWVAGFSGLKHTKCQSLAYLMRIGEAFNSYGELYTSSKLIYGKVLESKLASLNPRGDMYSLKKGAENFLSASSYEEPQSEDHVHSGIWERDVEIDEKYSRPSALLVGDPDLSWGWSNPLIYWNKEKSYPNKAMKDGCQKMNLATWLSVLAE